MPVPFCITVKPLDSGPSRERDTVLCKPLYSGQFLEPENSLSL